MTADRHCDSFRNASPDKISDAGTAEIVEKFEGLSVLINKAALSAGFIPCAADALNTIAATEKHP